MAGAPPRSTDLDFADVFADVFGGPPRRSSGNDRRSRRDSLDTSSFGSSAPRARSGEAETPVFGDRGSGDRRSHLGEEFYRDIFPGSEAALPRRAVAGGLGGCVRRTGVAWLHDAPAIELLHEVQQRHRHFDSYITLSKTSNRNDDGTSYSYSIPTSPDSQMYTYLSQETPQHDSKKKPFSWHRYPLLSRFRSQSGDKKNTSNHVSFMESEGEGAPVSVENIMATDKFHFSFYKWAGKGALLALPATMEEKDAAIIGLKSFPQVVVQGFDLIDEEDSVSTATEQSKSQTDYEDSKSGKYSTYSATKEGPVPLFIDGDSMQGMKHSTHYSKNDVSSDSLSAKSSRPPSGERNRSSRVKRKVKDFMKIFSPQGSPKRKGAPEAQDQTSSAKNESKTDLQDKFTLSSSEASEDVQTIQNNQNTFIDVPSTMSEVQERMEKPVMATSSKMEGKMDMTSERNESAPNESIGGGKEDKLDNTLHHEERYVEDLDGFLVEHITEDPVLHNDQEKEQIKIAESKIREWSRGKEGNIRSLLSTLQYVLWPESGWKPVPLVDVIEGAAVKKAYQKALLCLHPDKLQQRGASMHQKYIAEKVFDILQESWKEFNSVTFG